MDRDEYLPEIKRLLAGSHGDQVRGVVFDGSGARDTADADRGIHLLVLLKGPIDYRAAVERLIRVPFSLNGRSCG